MPGHEWETQRDFEAGRIARKQRRAAEDRATRRALIVGGVGAAILGLLCLLGRLATPSYTSAQLAEALGNCYNSAATQHLPPGTKVGLDFGVGPLTCSFATPTGVDLATATATTVPRFPDTGHALAAPTEDPMGVLVRAFGPQPTPAP